MSAPLSIRYICPSVSTIYSCLDESGALVIVLVMRSELTKEALQARGLNSLSDLRTVMLAVTLV
jgi:hypothetical protein